MPIAVEHRRWSKTHAVLNYSAGYSMCGIPLKHYVFELAVKSPVTCKNCLRILERRKKYAVTSDNGE